jgi:chemotaxis protein methyltransferase CheR
MSDFLNDALFQNMRDYIYGESGIHFSESNRSILESRLKERLRSLETETPARYLDLLKNDKEETRYFLDAITTNLTRFFRNQAHYDTFINYVIPDLVNYKKSGRTSNPDLERRLFHRRGTLHQRHGPQ